MVRLDFSLQLGYQVAEWPCDFIFNIQAAQTRCQRIVKERLSFNQQLLPQSHTDPVSGNRFSRLRTGPGQLTVHYEATVEIAHHVEQAESLVEVPVSHLPAEVLPYLYPSRYCQSDLLSALAMAEFGQMRQGYTRVKAIQHWVQRGMRFTSGVSNHHTSALDSLQQRAGVCRDFAHLMIALCRALNIPARFTTGIDYGADPALGPTDFHAYVEVFLGHRWYLFDPSGTAIPMGFVRFGTGRDAADVSFATIFGNLESFAPRLQIEALVDPVRGFELPRHRNEALSTDAG